MLPKILQSTMDMVQIRLCGYYYHPATVTAVCMAIQRVPNIRNNVLDAVYPPHALSTRSRVSYNPCDRKVVLGCIE
jgi:hypothetical protein